MLRTPSAPQVRQLREWVDSTGQHKVKARLKSYGNGKVTIEKEDGTTVTLPISRLRKDDQQYVEQVLQIAP